MSLKVLLIDINCLIIVLTIETILRLFSLRDFFKIKLSVWPFCRYFVSIESFLKRESVVVGSRELFELAKLVFSLLAVIGRCSREGFTEAFSGVTKFDDLWLCYYTYCADRLPLEPLYVCFSSGSSGFFRLYFCSAIFHHNCVPFKKIFSIRTNLSLRRHVDTKATVFVHVLRCLFQKTKKRWRWIDSLFFVLMYIGYANFALFFVKI